MEEGPLEQLGLRAELGQHQPHLPLGLGDGPLGLLHEPLDLGVQGRGRGGAPGCPRPPLPGHLPLQSLDDPLHPPPLLPDRVPDPAYDVGRGLPPEQVGEAGSRGSRPPGQPGRHRPHAPGGLPPLPLGDGQVGRGQCRQARDWHGRP